MPQLTESQKRQFESLANEIAEKATKSELYQKALISVAANCIEYQYGDEHLANDVRDLIPETQENED